MHMHMRSQESREGRSIYRLLSIFYDDSNLVQNARIVFAPPRLV